MTRPSWPELRRQYPNIPFSIFCRIAEKAHLTELDEDGIQILHLILQEEEEKERKEVVAEGALIRERLTEISGSSIHNSLRVNVPEEIDLRHIQAYVVYGLLASTQSRMFAGGRRITKQRLQTVVENKLGGLFDKNKFEDAHAWLVKTGVVSVDSTTKGLALNVSRKGCTAEGLAIIEGAKKFKLELRSLI